MNASGHKPIFSLCMILRNEAANLERSLGPIHQCFDEIVVVDTGSTDNTVQIAQAYGARVQHLAWTGDFAAARNCSLDAAQGDWIMWLDGDNSVTPQAVDILRGCLDEARDSIIWCTEVVIPDGERLMQKRVFPRRPDVFFRGQVHEQLVHPQSFKSVIAPVEIMHWGYSDKALALEKGQRNLKLLEAMLRDDPDDFYLCYQMGRTLANLRDFKQALFWLNKTTESNQAIEANRGVWLHANFLKAQTLERLGKYTQAQNVYLYTLRQAPDYAPAHYGLGRQYFAAGQYQQAAEHLGSFLENDSAEIFIGLGLARMRYTAALMRGRCQEASGAPQEAVPSYELAAQMEPVSPEPLLALAKLARLDGDLPQARQYLERCLKLAPNDRRAGQLSREVAGRD